MESKRASKTAMKDKGLLVSFARTIGSTLGAVAAQADALSKPAPQRAASRKSTSKANKTRKKTKA